MTEGLGGREADTGEGMERVINKRGGGVLNWGRGWIPVVTLGQVPIKRVCGWLRASVGQCVSESPDSPGLGDPEGQKQSQASGGLDSLLKKHKPSAQATISQPTKPRGQAGSRDIAPVYQVMESVAAGAQDRGGLGAKAPSRA